MVYDDAGLCRIVLLRLDVVRRYVLVRVGASLYGWRSGGGPGWCFGAVGENLGWECMMVRNGTGGAWVLGGAEVRSRK